MMKIDRSQMVQEGVLYLDRDWIGGPMTVSPFGKDTFIHLVLLLKTNKLSRNYFVVRNQATGIQ